MPWYTDPVMTCKVLDKIAHRYERAAIEELQSILEAVATMIWKKQQHFLAEERRM